MTDVMAGEQDWRLKAELDPTVSAGGAGGMEGAGDRLAPTDRAYQFPREISFNARTSSA
jgi:hypothetical protein